MVTACNQPRMSRTLAFPCGKCPGCVSLRRRTWATRIFMESLCHEENAFVTLTYASDRRELFLGDVRSWIKRLRSYCPEEPFRVFYTGEYGGRTQRPHYHAHLFGFGSCRGGPIEWRNDELSFGKGGFRCECDQCRLVRCSWGFGHVLVGSVNLKTAMYIAKYAVKGMTHSSHPDLDGRAPEFARMSLRPGIGAPAARFIANAMLNWKLVQVPAGIRIGPRIYPLGRYVRQKVKELVPEATLGSEVWLLAEFQKMSVLRSYAQAVDKQPIEILKEIGVIPTIPAIHSLITTDRL